MAIKINANMALGSAQYLDARQSVATLDELLALDTNIIPNGFECYVEALDCKYKYHTDYNETDTGHWKLMTSDGAEGKSAYQTWLDLGNTGTEQDFLDSLGGSASINDNNISLDSTWSSEKIANNYSTKEYVAEQISNAEHLKREIVTVLPSDEEASDNIIYMLKVESATGNDKYQEYMKIDGTVQMVGDTSVDLTDYAKSAEIPTTVAELTDSADYAKKTDIPTTLPANGGNADTVNNHTVKSDVPENAVFTDTVYDDTELKGSIEEINDSLVDLDEKKADADKVVNFEYIRDTSSEDAKELIQKHWSEHENFKFYNLHLDTGKWAWSAEIYFHTSEYGTVLLRSYGNDASNIWYGKVYAGVWTWKELATMDKVDKKANIIQFSQRVEPSSSYVLNFTKSAQLGLLMIEGFTPSLGSPSVSTYQMYRDIRTGDTIVKPIGDVVAKITFSGQTETSININVTSDYVITTIKLIY